MYIINIVTKCIPWKLFKENEGSGEREQTIVGWLSLIESLLLVVMMVHQL